MMRNRDAAGVKKARLEKIYKMITQTDRAIEEDLNLSVFLSQIAWNIGLSESTSLKYLRHLENLGAIQVLKEENKILVLSRI
jgi:Fic family protein